MDVQGPQPSDLINPEATYSGALNDPNTDPNNTYLAPPTAAPLETITVHQPGSVEPAKDYTQKTIPKSIFSKRRVIIVSSIITVLVTLITGAVILYATRHTIQSASSNITSPQQDVSLNNAALSTVPSELQGSTSSLLVNGDIVTRGSLKLSNNGYLTVIKTNNATASQTLILPNSSGTVCLDSNNCSYASINQFNQLQQLIGQTTVGDHVVSLNGQTNNVTIQGTANRVNVVSGGGLITLSAPQDLAVTSSPSFGSLGLSGNLSVSGTFTTALDCTSFASGGALTTNGAGQVICSDDDAGGGSPISGSGSLNRLPLFTAATTLGDSWLLQNGSTLELDNTRDLSLLGGELVLDSSAGDIRLLESTGGTFYGTLDVGDLTSNQTYTFPDAGGTVCLSSGNCAGIGGTGDILNNGQNGPVTVGTNDSTGLTLETANTPRLSVSSAGSITVSGLNTAGIVHTNGSGTLSTSDVLLGTETAGSYVANLGSLTGLSTTGNSGEGSTPTLAVLYGSAANTAVQGNVALTCPSGAGNLTGGGTLITLGTGGACGNLSTVNNPTFTTSVTTPQVILTGAGSNGTLQIANLGQPTVYTLPDPGGAGANICLSSGNCVGIGGGAPNSSAYLTIGNDGTLTNERGIAAGTNLNAVDGGANGSYTLSVINNPTFSGLVSANGGLSVQAGQTLTVNSEGFTDLTGTGLTISGGALQATLGTSISNAEIDLDAVTLGTQTTGNYVATITAGNGISGSSSTEGGTPTIALGNLTADWLQAGAFDLTLSNSASELKILESVGGSFYGIFDVGDLSADQTYTFTSGGTVCTTTASTCNGTYQAAGSYENPLTFTNGLTRTVNSVSLGGTLSGATDIALNGNNLTFSGIGNVGIGDSTPAALLTVGNGDPFQVNSTGNLSVTTTNVSNIAVFDTTNASANGTSIDVQSASSSQYALKVTTNNGANTAFQVRGDGKLTASSLTSCDKVNSDSSGVLGCGTSVENHVNKIEFTGHSQTHGYGASDPSLRWTSKLSKLLHATEVNRGINGGIAIGNTIANGGWVNVVQNVTRSRTSAPYLSPTNMAAIQLGHNDLPFTAAGGTNQFSHAMRTMISRYRSAAVFEESSATIGFTGTWSNQAGSANSGTGYKQTSTNGDSYTISVPADFPGGTVAVGLIGVTGGNGALHTFTVDGGAAGSLNTKSIASAASLGLSVRFTGLSAGAHTIVGTISSVTGNTGFDYWQIEAQQPPLVTVLNTTRALSYTGGLTDSDVNTLNTAMQSVVNEFDSSVVYVNIDSVINKNSLYFTSDGVHYNDLGNAKIAETVYSAVANSSVSVAQLTNTGTVPYTEDSQAFRNTTNNANSFAVQNAAGNNVLSVNTSINSVGIGVIGNPLNLLGVASTTGGSLPSATYTYSVTALDGYQESDPANTSVVVTGPTGSVSLSWDAVAGATSYRVYTLGTARYFTVTTNSFTDTTYVGTTVGSPPTAITSTTKLRVLGSSGTSAELRVEVKENTSPQLSLVRNQTGGSFNTAWAAYVPLSSTDFRLFNSTPFKDLFGLTATGAATFENSTNSITAFQVQNANATFGAGTTVLDVDTSNTRVGIGNAAPSTTLHVTGNARITGLVSCDTIDTDASGNLACGTDSGAASSTLQNAYDNDTNGSDTLITLSANDDSLIFRNPAASGTDSTYILTLDQLNTGAKAGLFINQLGTSYALRVDDSSGDTTPFVIDDSGKVGISNASPGNLLSVGALATADASGQLAVSTGSAGNVGVIIQGVNAQTGDLLQAQDKDGNVLASIDANGLLTVSGAVVNGDVVVTGGISISNLIINDGHIFNTQTTAPTSGTPTSCGSGAPTSSVTAGSTDSAGSFTITSGTGVPTSCDTVITFNIAYGSAPKSIIVSPKATAGAAARQIYVSASTTTTFTVKFGVNASASTAYDFYYWIVQ